MSSRRIRKAGAETVSERHQFRRQGAARSEAGVAVPRGWRRRVSALHQGRARLHEGDAGMSKPLYAIAAESLNGNEEQLEAYESDGHCVVLAGPGAGKTKTIT